MVQIKVASFTAAMLQRLNPINAPTFYGKTLNQWHHPMNQFYVVFVRLSLLKTLQRPVRMLAKAFIDAVNR